MVFSGVIWYSKITNKLKKQKVYKKDKLYETKKFDL